jgi:hypothetical protein
MGLVRTLLQRDEVDLHWRPGRLAGPGDVRGDMIAQDGEVGDDESSNRRGG